MTKPIPKKIEPAAPVETMQAPAVVAAATQAALHPDDVAALQAAGEALPAEVLAEIEGWLPRDFVRQPFGALEFKLSAPQRPGFHRHWFNDNDERVTRAIAAGYKPVKGPDGKNITRTVGTTATGQGLRGILMETPLKWHLDSLKKGQRIADEREHAIKHGDVRRSEGDSRYQPRTVPISIESETFKSA